MLFLVGTAPVDEARLWVGPGRLDGDGLIVGEAALPLLRGSTAMMAAALAAGQVLEAEAATCVTAGDIGAGDGTGLLYDWLVDCTAECAGATICLHYMLPNVHRHNEFLAGLDELASPPRLIADAGFMYVAKMSGQAARYQVFTPDMGEMAFLADEQAPHPFYTRGFIFHREDDVEEMVARAYAHGNAAQVLLVKGETDYICADGRVVDAISQPSIPALEAIGGTGDTLTGLVAALLATGRDAREACVIAARANRRAGELAQPTPATQVAEIVAQVPQALAEALA
ncbi:MAG: NAD(P)H-hydrate dehydratase [Armatimonadota bacterium]